ncbi:hypothetical protein U1Q18_013253 [Sarracenia purpurea var. burkii]
MSPFSQFFLQSNDRRLSGSSSSCVINLARDDLACIGYSSYKKGFSCQDGGDAHVRGMSEENPPYEMADERDKNAAHILVEMANCLSHLTKNNLQSFRRSPGVFGVSNNKLLPIVLGDCTRHDATMLGIGGKTKETFEKLNSSSSKANHMERKQKKREVDNIFSLPRSKKRKNQCITKEGLNCLHEMHKFGNGCLETKKKKMNKRKTKADEKCLDGWNDNDHLDSESKNLIGEPILKKKSGLQKVDDETVFLRSGVINDMLHSDDASVDDLEPAEKQQFPFITPTCHTGFSFSIIHLLSAVHLALVTPLAEDFTNRNLESIDTFHSCEYNGVVNSEQAEERTIPSLTIHEIVRRVKLKPGDPCILETQEPLLDLVRGVLKIFSSRTSPLGAKGWKPLTKYAKSTKRWSWVGPISSKSSSGAWGFPRKMIVKLVDCFADWLKNGQETLKQIGCLPAPPMVLWTNPTTAKERFKDLRSQRSLTTISPSSDEVRTYFRREETLRYLVPERAFSYTALDGRKSTVAPLRRCGGNPSARARDHFMLKTNRPPHVTVLCLVRDAAARLPGSIGTRGDVCTLIRDSQFIVDGISDAQVNQVVSGALDRLHYELDPCVKYNRDRHLWVYLHREREEEDFEIDGTCSKRKV